jgi:two-component system, OmpR family, aerobic respiration control sensor histidine kinase ArcB
MNRKNRKKILLVEDSPLPQRVVKTLLEQLDCHVDVAATGEDSIVLCKKNRYDLIFMDIGLPGIDGIMAAQLIREQESPGCHVPIVALTAHDDTTLKVNVIAAGMDDYLVKPLSLQLAQNILSIYCHERKASSSSKKDL